ncbi:MAG TPA: hypothetical protein PK715_12000 [Chitinophagales bacterium]|nr:hypothetical protein [Chitinophagales bacterium]
MLSGYYAMDVLLTLHNKSFADAPDSNLFHLLALCRVAFAKYISLKISPDASVTTQIIKQYETGDVTAIKKIYLFITKFLKDKLPNSENEQQAVNRDDLHTKFLKNKTTFDRIKDELENSIIQVSDIDNLS